MRDRLLADSPAAALTYRKRKKPIRKTSSPAEFVAIVADIRTQPFNADAADSADFVEFIGLASLGQAATSALTWADVDWQNEQITTFRKKTSRGFMVPLYPQLRPLLSGCARNVEERRLAMKKCSGSRTPRRLLPGRANGLGCLPTLTAPFAGCHHAGH